MVWQAWGWCRWGPPIAGWLLGCGLLAGGCPWAWGALQQWQHTKSVVVVVDHVEHGLGSSGLREVVPTTHPTCTCMHKAPGVLWASGQALWQGGCLAFTLELATWAVSCQAPLLCGVLGRPLVMQKCLAHLLVRNQKQMLGQTHPIGFGVATASVLVVAVWCRCT